jgi:hypothetical protein
MWQLAKQETGVAYRHETRSQYYLGNGTKELTDIGEVKGWSPGVSHDEIKVRVMMGAKCM